MALKKRRKKKKIRKKNAQNKIHSHNPAARVHDFSNLMNLMRMMSNKNHIQLEQLDPEPQHLMGMIMAEIMMKTRPKTTIRKIIILIIPKMIRITPQLTLLPLVSLAIPTISLMMHHQRVHIYHLVIKAPSTAMNMMNTSSYYVTKIME